jgi:hypothetical protein
LLSLITLIICSQLDHFGFAAVSSPQTAGDSFSVTMYAFDAANQIVTTYNGHPWVYTSLGPSYCNKQMSFINGVCTDNVTVTLAADLSLICNDYQGHTGQSNSFTVQPNIPQKLLSLVPNQIHEPGTLAGKSGTVSGQIAGEQFSITVYVTDRWSNIVDTTNHTVNCTTNDPFISPPPIQTSNGIANFALAYRTAGSRIMIFRDATTPSIKSDTSSAVTVYAAQYSKLLVVLPGDTLLPGDTTHSIMSTPGKSGATNDQYVSEDFVIIVYATDSMWNRTTASGYLIQLTGTSGFSNPAPQNLSNGEAQFLAQFTTSGEKSIYATDNTNIIVSYENPVTILARASDFIITVDPDTISPGTNAIIGATVNDRNGTPIEGKLVSFSVIAGHGFIVPPFDAVYTNSAGYCQSQFAVSSGYFNEMDTILVRADNYSESTTCYIIIPDSTVMEGNLVAFPNPFGSINSSRQTRFMYFLSSSCNVIYAIYDPFGNLVHREDIAPGQNGARQGLNVITWDGRNDKHKRVASGIYYVVFKGYMFTNIFLEKRIKVGVIW